MSKQIIEPIYKKGVSCPQRRSSGTFIKGQYTKENHFRWKGGLPYCEICGQTLSAYTYKKCQSCYIKTLEGKGNPMYGKVHTEKTKKIIREKRVNQIITEETKKKMGESHRREKSYFWKGGITNRKYSYEWTETLKKSIRQRDNYKCRNCGIPQEECFKKLHIHHIDYNKDNLNPDNLISLCPNCHSKTNVDREYWKIKLGVCRE